jgi:hypothetical protein
MNLNPAAVGQTIVFCGLPPAEQLKVAALKRPSATRCPELPDLG